MANAGRKRKAVTRDSASSEQVAVVDELGNRSLNGILSDNEEEPGFVESDVSSEAELNGADSEADLEDEDEFDLDSDEIPSEEESENPLLLARKSQMNGSTTVDKLSAQNEDDSDDSGEDEHVGTTKDYVVTQDANGNPRYVYRDIEPVYDSDDSDAPATANTIGNIPLSFYDSYPHIGYDIDGKKVMRPLKGAALDSLLDSIELPKGWTGLTDPATGKPLELSAEELDVLKRLTRNELPEDGYDPYPDMVEYFSGKLEQMPLSAAPEPKRRFIPSKHEAKRVMKIVKAIREGRILPYKPPSDDVEEDTDIKRFDIWADEAPRPDHVMNIPAPKLPPPGYDESYHPPQEYVPDEKERKEWQELDEEDRERDWLPKDHDALRKVAGYEQFIKEKFERCLDLYLAPRVRRDKLNIDPESLLPKLPSPEELRPFPSRCDIVFKGHKGRVRSVAIDPHGRFLASGGDDGTVKLWGLDTGRQLVSIKLSDSDAVDVIRWRPGKETSILAAAAGQTVYLIAPEVAIGTNTEALEAALDLLKAGYAPVASTSTNVTTEPPARWGKPEVYLQEQGVLVQLTVRATVKVISWHRRGDYFATVSPTGQSSAVAIHTLSKHLTQLPFRKLKGLAQSVQFHPSKPVLFVATQRMIRSYDLQKQELLKILQPGARWISSFDIHPGGDNLIIGSYDKRLLWIDLDLSPRPYKTLRYHKKAIRAARFHQGGYPLFADTSDDGTLQIFHGKVVGDLMENASIVPLKVLKGHSVENGLGVLDLDWHPTDPWCVSAGADGTCRLWRP